VSVGIAHANEVGHDLDRLLRIARDLRRDVIQLAHSSKSGHIGSSLSCVELLVALYFSFLRGAPTEEGRDRFIMSKGHACTPFYGCLVKRGWLPESHYRAYGEEGGPLGHHPLRHPEWGIEISSGSLGHGLSIGAGLAKAAKLDGHLWRSVVLMSDGEQNEGTVWEAVGFAAQHQLDNLVAIVDFNKIQALGDCRDIIGLEPLEERYRAFGWAVRRLDGHDLGGLVEALRCVPFERGKPSVLIADTVKGKGVSFMENSLLWHYRCPDATELAAALRELADA